MLRFRPKKDNYILVERDSPELFKELFPYTEPPRVYFDGKYLPLQPAENFYITDTTFRDGQ